MGTVAMLGLSRGFLRKVLGFMMSFSTLPALTNSCIPLEDGWPTVPQEETKAQKCTQGGKLQDSESNGTNSRLKETGTNSEELCVYNLYIKCSMCLNVNHKDQPFECSYQKKHSSHGSYGVQSCTYLAICELEETFSSN